MEPTGSADASDRLHIAGRDAVALAQQYGTPLFVYDVDRVRRNFTRFHEAFQRCPVPLFFPLSPGAEGEAGGGGGDTGGDATPLRVPKYQIAYASKALSLPSMYRIVKTLPHAAVDVVSGGELHAAIAAGVDPRTIHFHGNNKSEAELRLALEAGVGCFVVDNFNEIATLDRLTRETGRGRRRVVDVLLRVSPGVAANTHTYNTTGQTDSKFGFDLLSGQGRAAYAIISGQGASAPASDTAAQGGDGHRRRAGGCEYLRVIGLHCHIGSQIFSAAGHALAARRLLEVAFEWGLVRPVYRRRRGRRHCSCACHPDHDDGSNTDNTNNNDTGVGNDDACDGYYYSDCDSCCCCCGGGGGNRDDGSSHRFVLNVGGGYGVRYTAEDSPIPPLDFVRPILESVAAFFREKARLARPPKPREGERGVCAAGDSGRWGFAFPEMWVEPGRSIVGPAGTTLYTVGARKTIPSMRRTYISVDGGMSDNIRPMLYQAKYTAVIANRMGEHARFDRLGADAQALEVEATEAAIYGCNGVAAETTTRNNSSTSTTHNNNTNSDVVTPSCGGDGGVGKRDNWREWVDRFYASYHSGRESTDTSNDSKSRINLKGGDNDNEDGRDCQQQKNPQPGEGEGMLSCVVVGKLCESGDQLIKNATLPSSTRPGDIMAVFCTGAYGYAMASNYNQMCRPAVLFIDEPSGREWVAARRETLDDLIARDTGAAEGDA